jgi:hypothetical protein
MMLYCLVERCLVKCSYRTESVLVIDDFCDGCIRQPESLERLALRMRPVTLLLKSLSSLLRKDFTGAFAAGVDGSVPSMLREGSKVRQLTIIETSVLTNELVTRLSQRSVGK